MLQKQHFDLYLLCDIDLPWEPDPLREHPNNRRELYAKYEAELIKRNWPYKIISGFDNERLNLGVQAIETFINRKNNF